MPPAFVETLFDQYADRFDEHLVEVLDYRVPELIASVVDRIYKSGKNLRILDLGCGTGLAGEHLKEYAVYLKGIDLSNGMLEQAANKKIYDDLAQAEILEFLQEEGRDVFELIVAADVLSYFGALENTLSAVAKKLCAGGYFIFSVQALADPPPDPGQTDYYLGRSRRFSHSFIYLERAISRSELVLVSADKTILRQDEGQGVEGYIICCRRSNKFFRNIQ